MNLYEIKNLENKHILLKNIDNKTLSVLHPVDIKLSLRYNDISTLEFKIYKDMCPYYDLITSYRRIEIEDTELFIIDKPQIINDGLDEYKIISCRSFEVDVNRKTIPVLNGTYKFYSLLETEKSIISIILSYLPNWTIKEIDSSLWNVFRSFDLQNIPLLQLIRDNIQNSFECVFEFNGLTREISVKAYENVPKKTDIYLSYNNLVNELQLTEKTEDIFTALSVFGAGENLSINLVNPTGSTIYNFNHFLNEDGFMSDTLKVRINEWQNLIEANQTIYSGLLTQRATKLSELIALQIQLTDLQGELKTLESVRDALLDSGLNATEKNTEVKLKKVEVANKEDEVNNKQIEVNNIDTQLQAIQNLVAFNNFFTQQELLEIEPFIIQTAITDDNFVITSLDSELDKQNTAQALYDKYKNLLEDASKLKHEFSVDLLDFISIEEYKAFTNQVQFGSQVTIEVNDEKELTYPMLLGLDIDWSDNIKIQYLFSTEVKLSDAMMNYDDFSNEVSNLSNKMASDGVKWSEYVRSGSKDRLNSIFEQGLKTDLIPIINSSNQELLINEQGLLSRRLNEDGFYDDEQIKLIHNKLAFTKDDWSSLETVIGKITMPDGSQNFGVNAQVLMGKLLTSNQLQITNPSGNFIIDNDGITINDLALKIKHNDGTTETTKTIEQALNDTGNVLTDFINTVYSSDIADIQAQIDGVVNTWFYDYEPTLSNEPAILWTTENDKKSHVGDLFYDTISGYAYRFIYKDDTYQWLRITDSDVMLALENASKAQDTADSKRRIFVTTPTVPYDKGDLWWINSGNVDFKICTTSNTVSYNPSDWSTVNQIKNYIDTQKSELDNSISNLSDEIDTAFSDTSITNIEAQSLSIARDRVVAEANDVKIIATDLAVPTTSLSTAINNLNAEVNKYVGKTNYPITVTSTDRTKLSNVFKLLEGEITKLYKAIDEVRINGVNNSLTNYIDNINSNLTGLIDDKFDIWFYATTPTLNNSPTNTWLTNSDKDKHINDLYYNTTTGYAYRFVKNNNIYSWQKITDKDITEALSKANQAQTTADSKIVSYYQNSEPLSGSEGDLWADTNDNNKLYRHDGAKWVLIRDGGFDDIATDLNNAITTVNENIGNVEKALRDEAIVTYYTNTEPPAKEGDLWFNTHTRKLYIHDSVSFKLIEDADITTAIGLANTAQETADGKIVSFYQDEEPVESSIGDLWIDTNDNNKLYRYDGNKWLDVHDKTIDNVAKNLNDAITTINDSMSSMQEAIEDNMIVTYYQSEEPTGKFGDLWFDTSDDKLYRYSTKWDLIEDSGITDAINKAQNAQSTADGKIVSYYQDEMPSTGTVGDLWIDTNDGNKLYRYDGKTYVSVQDASIEKVATDLSSAITTINDSMIDLQSAIEDGQIVTYYQDTEPDGKIGDMWFNTVTKKLYRYETQDIEVRGNRALRDMKYFSLSDMQNMTNNDTLYKSNIHYWRLVEDEDITVAFDKAQNAQTTADGKIVSFYQSDMPKEASYGDLWIDTDDKNTVYRYDGKSWVLAIDANLDDINNNIDELFTKIGSAFKYDGVLDASKLDGIIDATHAYMMSANNQVIFDGTGMWSLDNPDKNKATEAVWLNERGILLGVRKNTGEWLAKDFSTAVTAQGINADYITSGQINAIDFIGGSLNIGSGNFTVDVYGNMVANSGKFTGEIVASNFKQGSIIGSSINVGDGNFVVDGAGNVSIKGTLNVADKLILDDDGNLKIDAEKITWITHDPKIAIAQRTANTALENTATLTQTISGITTRVTDTEGNISNLQQTASSLTSRITKTEEDASGIKQDMSTVTQTVSDFSVRIQNNEGSISSMTQSINSFSTRITSAEGNISTISQNVSNITTRIGNAEGNISTVTQTVNGFSTRISSAEGNISTVTQTVNGFSTRISSAEGNISSITQTTSGIALAINNSKLSFNTSGLTITNGGFKILAGSKQLLYVDGSGNLNISGYFSGEGITVNSNGTTLTGGKFNVKSGNTTVFEVYSSGDVWSKGLHIGSSLGSYGYAVLTVPSDGSYLRIGGNSTNSSNYIFTPNAGSYDYNHRFKGSMYLGGGYYSIHIGGSNDSIYILGNRVRWDANGHLVKA